MRRVRRLCPGEVEFKQLFQSIQKTQSWHLNISEFPHANSTQQSNGIGRAPLHTQGNTQVSHLVLGSSQIPVVLYKENWHRIICFYLYELTFPASHLHGQEEFCSSPTCSKSFCQSPQREKQTHYLFTGLKWTGAQRAGQQCLVAATSPFRRQTFLTWPVK